MVKLQGDGGRFGEVLYGGLFVFGPAKVDMQPIYMYVETKVKNP